MTINPRPNPYVGARPYQQGETLYGRGREQRRLLNQLIADRIVLLNSPSGAGKTSLIQAALIPDLQAEHFNVLPVARVNTEPPKELAGRGDVNRYLLSLLLSLDEGLREDSEPTPLDALAAISLDEYLAKVEAADPLRSVVLIVDQFEEIVTVDPTDDAGRQIFFDALSVALRNRKRWALFAMREEFVTRLDPLVRMVPTRLAMRFRLELLSPAGATEAIKGPAGDQGVAFDDQAAERLVNDLRTVRVQQEDGTSTDMLGNSVEPVQLQVVCQRLWSGLSADDMDIGPHDVAALGDVSQALEAYYDEQVGAAAGGKLDRERAIRDWFESQLITEQGIRTQIAQEPNATRSLDNDVIDDLVHRRLVRRERRRAVNWYELAHDRLIRPVLNSNAAWRESHLAGWQQQAILWDQQGRPNDLLLSGSKLAKAENQAAGTGELAPLDQAFLDSSRDRRRQRRLRRTLAGTIGVLLVTAILLVGNLVIRETNRAQIDIRMTESARLAAQGEQLQFSEPDLAALLEVESNEVYQTGETVSAGLGVLNNNPRLERVVRLAGLTGSGATGGHVLEGPALDRSSKKVSAVAISPNGETVAAATDSAVYLIDRKTGALIGDAPLILEIGSSATDMAFSPDGSRLIVPDLSGAVTVWDLTADPPVQQTFQAAPGVINGFALDPAGSKMVVIGKNGATVWPLPEDVTTAQPAELLSGMDARSVAWSPNGTLVAVGDSTGAVSLVGDGRSPVVTLTGPKGIVKAVAFSPDSTLVAAAIETSNRDLGQSVVLVWPVDGDQPSARFVNTRGTVTSLAFVENGTALATGGKDNHIDVWDLQSGLPQDQALPGSRQSVSDMAYDIGSQTLVSGDGDGRVFLWRFDTPNRLARPLLGHTDQVFTVAFSPDDTLLASGGKDGTVRLWNLASGNSQILGTHTPLVRSVAFSPDGDLLASAGLDDIKLWQLQPEPTLLHTLTGPGAQALGDLVFSSDGKTMATSDSDTGAIYLWDMTSQPPQARQLATDVAGPLFLTFAPGGGTMYAANKNGEVHSWDTATGEAGSFSVSTGDGSPLLDLTSRANGEQLVAASANSAIYLWTREGSPYGVGVLAGHSLPVSGIDINSDSGNAASVGYDGELILWDFGSQQPIGVFRGHDGPVNAVAFSHDGALVATAGDDHTVLLWQATADQWEAAACRLAARTLTDDEVERYLGYGRTSSACRDLAASATP